MGFDKTKVFKDEIQSLVKEIVFKCDREHIPCLLVFAIKDDDKTTVYDNHIVSPPDIIDEMTQDYIPKCVNVLRNGFETIPASSFTERKKIMDMMTKGESEEGITSLADSVRSHTTNPEE